MWCKLDTSSMLLFFTGTYDTKVVFRVNPNSDVFTSWWRLAKNSLGISRLFLLMVPTYVSLCLFSSRDVNQFLPTTFLFLPAIRLFSSKTVSVGIAKCLVFTFGFLPVYTKAFKQIVIFWITEASPYRCGLLFVYTRELTSHE